MAHALTKLKFHGTDTDTGTDTDFLADFRDPCHVRVVIGVGVGPMEFKLY